RRAGQAVPGARGAGGRRPAVARAEAQDGAPPGVRAGRVEAARQGRDRRRGGGGGRRRARPLNAAAPAPSRLSGATIVALFVAAFAAWFLLRVADVLLLVFIAVLCAVYLAAITDALERRFRVGRGLGLASAVAGVGALLVPPVIDQTQALVASLPETLARIQGVLARWASEYPVLRRTELADPSSGFVAGVISDASAFLRASILPYARAGGKLFIEGASVVVMALYLAARPELYRAG